MKELNKMIELEMFEIAIDGGLIFEKAKDLVGGYSLELHKMKKSALYGIN